MRGLKYLREEITETTRVPATEGTVRTEEIGVWGDASMPSEKGGVMSEDSGGKNLGKESFWNSWLYNLRTQTLGKASFPAAVERGGCETGTNSRAAERGLRFEICRPELPHSEGGEHSEKGERLPEVAGEVDIHLPEKKNHGDTVSQGK